MPLDLTGYGDQIYQPEEKKKKYGYKDWISETIGVVGGLAGSLLGPAGAVAGATLGAGAGQALESKLKSEKITAGNVAKEAALSGAGEVLGLGVGNVAGKLLGKTATGLEKAGIGTIASQANLPRSAARAFKLGDTVENLSRYGINNIDDYSAVASKVTGTNGFLTKLTREAVAKANPVDTDGVLKIAQEIAGDPSMAPGADKKFVTFISKTLSNMYGGAKGSLATKADPSEVFGAIKKLQTKAAELVGSGKNPLFVTSADKSLASAYRSVADELSDRLFTGAGADKIIASHLVTPENAMKLKNILPNNKGWDNLVNDFLKTKSVSDLRSLQAPFVNASKIASETEAGSQNALMGAGGMAKSVGKWIPSLADPLAPIIAAAETNTGKSLTGSALKATGRMAQKVSGAITSPGGQLISGMAGQTALNSTNENQGALPTNPSDVYVPTTNQLEQDMTALPQQPSQAKMGLTSEDLNNLAISDMLTTGGQNLDKIKLLQGMIGGVPKQTKLSDTAIKTVSDYQTAATSLEGLRSSIESSNAIGPITGFRALNPYDTSAKSLQAQIDAVRQTVGRALEGGVLRKEDEEKYKKILPTVRDTKKVALQKIDYLMKKMAGNIENYAGLQNTRGGGTFTLPTDTSQVNF